MQLMRSSWIWLALWGAGLAISVKDGTGFIGWSCSYVRFKLMGIFYWFMDSKKLPIFEKYL